MAQSKPNRQDWNRWLTWAVFGTRALALGLFVAGGIALVSAQPFPILWWCALGSGGLYLGVTFAVWWRDVWCCPACEVYLGEDFARMRFCPKCGRRLAPPPKPEPDDRRERAE
jgi:hypothetical protein